MSKRDDDSQTDMEVGMTTAERRRRRRRGGGLRVPSDNVPRRSSTPPVAPVPEDPALAMSIAYSFTSESADGAPRVTRETAVPSFEHHESMPTVIDPVSGPIEQADFEMKTREMTAVDLEELGLDEPGISGNTMPFSRISSPGIEPFAPPSPAPPVAARFPRREATDPADDVEVDLDPSVDGMVDAGATIDQDGAPASDLDLDSAEPTTVHVAPPSPPADLLARTVTEPSLPPRMIEAMHPRPPLTEASQPRIPVTEATQPRPPAIESSPPRIPVADAAPPRPAMAPVMLPPPGPPGPPAAPSSAPPVAGYRTGRAQTVALSEDDLEEVREAARQSTPQPVAVSAPPHRSASISIPPPPPPAKPAEARPRVSEPASVPEIDILSLEDKAAEASGEFEVDVDGIVEAKPDELAAAVAQSPGPSSSLGPFPPHAEPRSRPISPPPGHLQPVSGVVSGTVSTTASGIVSGTVSSPSPLGHGHSPSSPPPSIPPPRESQSMAIPRDPHAPPSIPPPRESQSMAIPRDPYAPPSIPPPRESQSMAIPRDPHAPPPPPPRESQSMAIPRDPHAPPPPPPSALHKSPPSPPPAKKDKSSPGLSPPLAKPEARDGRDARPEVRGDALRGDLKPPRGKPWFIDLFDEDYLRTLPFLTPQATQAEAEFVIDAMGLTPGAQVLDIGCGYGRHAMELAARGMHVVGLDLSTPLLVRGGEEAHRRGLTINFVRGDMRELDFDSQFDGAYCLFSTFGYFDDETNKKTISNIGRALRPGGRVLIEILNRDYVIADLPTRVWWEGDGCVVLEEVELNYFSSRIQVNRSVVFDDGRQLEQEISVRAYSLHEVGKLMHSAGLRVLEVSGAYHTRGRFFGNQSRHIIVLAERKDPSGS